MISLNETFLKGFTKDNKDPAKLMEEWWLDEHRRIRDEEEY
jgi:hypothetical protein